MTAREVKLVGGSPWGFRMHGGHDLHQPLRISRVNPGSKAAQQGVREGDLISSINGKLTRNLTNSESHDLLRSAGEQLTLGLNQEGQIGSPKRRIYKSSLQENTSTETLKKITTKTISSNTRLVQQTSEQKINGSDDTRNDRSYVGQNGGLNTSTHQSNGEVKSAEDYEALDYATDAEDAFSTMPHNARARKNRRNRNRKRFQPTTTDKCSPSDETSAEVAPPNEINENCNGGHVEEGQDAALKFGNENDQSVAALTRLNGIEEDVTSENVDSEKDDVVYENMNFSTRKPKNRCRIEKKALDTGIRICEITTIHNLPCAAKVDHIPGVGILETGSTKAIEPFVTVVEPVEPFSKTVGSAVALTLLRKNNSLDIHEVSDSDVEPDNSKVVVVEAESDIEKEPVGEIVDIDEENTTVTQSEVVKEDATLEKYYEDLRMKGENAKDMEKTVRSEEETPLTAEEQELLKPEPPMSKEVEEKLRCFIEGLKLPASPEEARDDCQKAEDERIKAESKAAKKAKKRAMLESYFSQTQAANRFLGIIQEEGEKLSEDDEQHIRDFINEEISKYRREERKLRDNVDHEALNEFRESHISVKIEGPELVFLKESSDSPTTNENEVAAQGENVYESIEFKEQKPLNSDVVKVTTSVKDLPVLEDVQHRNFVITQPATTNHVNGWDSETRHPPDPPKRSSSFNNDVEPQRPPTPPEIDYLNALPEVPPLPDSVNSTGQKIPPVPPIRRKCVHFAEEDEMILIPERPPPVVQEEESFHETGCIADSIYENVNLTRSTCKHLPDTSSKSDVGHNHTIRICQSNVKTEENTVDFIKTLLTILTQRNTSYQDVQGFLSGFDLGVLPKNIRDIIDELMEPSSRASSESDSTELRNASDFVSENIGGSSNDATPETAHEQGDRYSTELPNSTHTLFEVPVDAVVRTENNVSESGRSLDEEFVTKFSSRSAQQRVSSRTTAQETPVIEAREKRERITTEIDAFTADATRVCGVKNNQSENTLDQRENNSEKQKLEEALCSTNALSPAELIDQDSSSSTASLSTAKYNPESSSLTDINAVIHEDEKTTTDSPQPKRKLKLLKENGDQKTDGKDDQDSPQPIPYSPVEDFYYPTFDESEGFENLGDAKPDLLKDLCIKKILSLPYGEQIINEITLPKFNIFKNLQTIQESVNLIPEGQIRNSKGLKLNDNSPDLKTAADTEKLSFEEMSKQRPRTWMGVPTREDPQVFICLSPSQQAKKSPNISADNLLDLHKKFIERRGYHESEKRDEKIVETYRMEMRKEDENLGSVFQSVGVEEEARNDGRSSRWSGDWHIPMPSNRLLEIIKENSVASHVGGSGTSSPKKEGIVPRSKDAIYHYYGSKCSGSSRNADGIGRKNCATITRVPSLEENQERLRATRLSDWLNLARRNSVDDMNNAPKMSGNLLIEESNRRKYETTDNFASTSNTRPVNNKAWGGCCITQPQISGSVNISNSATDVKINREERTEKISKVTTRKISESSVNSTKNVEQVHHVNSALIDCSGDYPNAPISRSVTPFSKNPISCNSAIIDKSSTAVEFERRTPIPKKNDVGKHVNVNSALINDKPEVPPKMKRSVNVDRSCIDTTSIFDKEPPRNHLQKRRHVEGDRMKQCTAVEIMENLKQLQSDMKQQMDDRRRFSLPQEYFDKQLDYIEQLEDQLKNVIIAEEEEQKAFEEVMNHVDKSKPRPHSIIGGPSVNFKDFKSTPEISRDTWSSKDRQDDENGYKHKDIWHEESKNISKDRSEYVKKDSCHEESKHISKENSCRTEESKSSESREERYVISKRGDVVERVQPRLNPFKTDRPKSTISAVATSGEKFREQMYNEYVNKVQEREDRKQHKVIKISSHKDISKRDNEKLNKVRGGSIEKEFIARAKNRLDKFGIKLDESESEVEGQSGDKVKTDDPKYVIDGDQVIDVRTLPKHLQEFLRLASQDDDAQGKENATDLLHEIDKALKFGNGFLLGEGVWSPGSEPPPPPKQPSPDRGKEGDASEKDGGIPPVWTPTSATTSPVVERKEFRPVPFESPVLSRKNKVQAQSSTEEASPPWEGEEYKKEASQILSQTITTRIVNSHSAPSQGLNTLASPPRLPRAQNPTITLLQKAREGQLPKGAAYLEEVNHGAAQSKNDEKPIISPGEIIYTVKKEYESETESENIRPKKMADLGPRKFEGIGPITKEGIPLVLRSEVKENNQAKWYKKMYDSLHRAEHDDDYITIRYKPRRGTRYGYGSASGYLSEPEPRGNVEKSATLDSRRRQRNKENDFSTSTIPRKNGSSVKTTTEIYRNQPGRIEDYEPGRSSIADKETKEWWDEVMDIFDGWLDENVSPRERASSEITSRDHRRLSESSRGQPGLSLSYMQGICPKRSSDINVDVKSVRELSTSSSGSKLQYPDNFTSSKCSSRRRSPDDLIKNKRQVSFTRADSQPTLFHGNNVPEIKMREIGVVKTRSRETIHSTTRQHQQRPSEADQLLFNEKSVVALSKSRCRSVLDLNRAKFHSLRPQRSLNKITSPSPKSYSDLNEFEKYSTADRGAGKGASNDAKTREDPALNIFRKPISMPEGKSRSFVMPDRCIGEINQQSLQQIAPVPAAAAIVAARAKRPTRLNRTMDKSDRVFLPQRQQLTSINNHHRLQQCLSPCRSTTSGTNHNIQPPQLPSAKTSAPLRPFEQHSTHTAKPYMSHALKESGYESDSTLVFRRREDASPLSPLEQRLAYKTVQRGGDVPLHGLRKPAPERPKDDDSVIEYFPISPTLTRIRVHKKIPSSTSKDSLKKSRPTVPTPPPPPPPSMIFSQYKRSAPSLVISPARSSHTIHLAGRSHSTPSRISSPPPGRPPSRVTSPSGRPPSPPRRKSSRNNTTLRLYSKMQIADNPQSSNPRHEQCFSADNVSNIRFLRERLSCNLEKHRREKEEAHRVRISRNLSTSPVTNRTKLSSTITANFSGQKSKTVSSPSPVSRQSRDTEPKTSGVKRPTEDKPPIKRVPSKSPMSTCSSRDSTVDRLYSPERTCQHGSRPRIVDTVTRKDQAKPRRTKKEQDEACKRLSRSPDLSSPQEVRRVVQRQREKDVQTKLLPSGTVVKSSTTLYSSARNVRQNPQEDKSLKVTVAISSKGRELLRKTTESSTSSRNQNVKSTSGNSPIVTRKTTFTEPEESPRQKIAKQRETSESIECKESLQSGSSFDTDGATSDCNKRKRSRDKPQTIVKSPMKKPETICMNPESKERKEEKRKSRKERNSESSKGKKSSNGKRNDGEKKRSKKALGKAAGSEIAKELKKLDPREVNVQRLTVEQIKKHQEIMKSDTFFQNLFLRNISSPTPSQNSVLRTSSVLERARIFQTENIENFKSEPSLRSLNIYLTSKKPVSNSKFKNWERESISSRCSSPYGVSWPGRSVLQKISKFDSLLSIDDYAMEFGSVSSFRGRSPDLTRDCHKERSLSEPPLKVLPENEERNDLEEAPPRPASPSPIRSPACRRIQSLRHHDTPGMTIMRKARARSAEEVDQRKKMIMGSTSSLCKSTSSLNLSQIDRDEYQQYVLEMLHCKRKSRRYRDLHDFYASLERMGELERTTSSGDLRPRLRNEEIIDYDRWKEVRSKERAERELEVLYGKLRNVQKEKDFLFRPKEVDQFRWKGDSGLRCKEKSVENIREQFKKLESQESELESSRRRDMSARKDVYKPLWRGNSVVSVAHTLDKRATFSENLERAVKPELPKALGVSRKLWSSLSIEQVNALKNQLNEIYSTDNGKPEVEKTKPTSKSDYEIVVPPQEEFGESFQEDNKTLHVRCHSMVTPDICKMTEKADSQLEEENQKSPLKRSGSISRGRSVERSQSDRSSGIPPMSELEKKRLSLTLSKEVLDKMTQRKVLQTPISPRETRGAIAAASGQSKQSFPSASPSFSSASPRTCYSLEMSEEGAGKSKDKNDFLLVLTPSDETPKSKRRVENVIDQWSKRQPEIAMVVSDETGKQSRPASTSEVDSTTGSSDASVKTVIRQGSAEDVPRKVEFYEKVDANAAEAKSIGNISLATSAPEGLERSETRSTFSQSFADLKELFGESESAKFATSSSYGSRPRSTSPRRSPIIPPETPHARLSRSFLPDENRERPRSASPFRQTSNTSSIDSLWKRSESPDPEKYWRAYLKLVRSGAVKRLRAKYESLEELPGGRIKVVPTPKRFRSDPELTRNLLKKEIEKVIVKGQEIADVNWLRRKYEAVPGRARRRGTSPPIPRVPLRMEDLGMPRIHVISKMAELKEQRPPQTTTSRRQEANELQTKRAVGRIRKKFERDHNVSILGEMFTSAPNVHELRDIAPYLAGQWVAHRFPSRRDNARSLSSPELENPSLSASSSPSRQVCRDANQEMKNFGRPRATSSSPIRPRRPPSILKQPCVKFNSDLARPDPFANQHFDPSKHRPRYRYQPTPPKVIHRESTPWWPPIPTYTARPTVTFEEYDTAPPPPPKAPHYRGDRQESPRRYVEGEVTIHYRSPVRSEAKEVLTEAELARRSAENMRRVYQEERRRKYLQELHDIDSRRHTDNFTPSQKSPIPLNRYDDFVDDLSHRSRSQEQTPEPRLVAKALYNFVGQSSRELTFRRGDIIFVRRQVDKNWYEGEHNAMIGLFPFNYVEILPYDGIRTTTPKKPYEGQARAKFNFVAQTTHELSLVKGDLVVLTRRVDQNWYEGRIGNRKGIFPISYVEVLVEPGVMRSETPAQNKPVAAPAAHSLLSNGSAGGKLSMGPHHYTPSIPTNTNAAQAHYNSLPRMGGTKLHVAPVNETLHIDTHSEPLRYRALYNYRPQNDDELELREGDSVYVMEKCDDGWFVGSSQRTGCFGTFPGNYVERL